MDATLHNYAVLPGFHMIPLILNNSSRTINASNGSAKGHDVVRGDAAPKFERLEKREALPGLRHV